MKIKYRDVRLSKANKERLAVINSIIAQYQSEGYILTLRQLYYQLVSRDIIPNKLAEYSKLSTLLKEGRMGGIVDWSAIEDRLRRPSSPSCWDSPKVAMQAIVDQYRRPRMDGQLKYVEVWVEKDALSGVLKRVTHKYGIPILVNRGYSSASAMFDAYKRFEDHLEDNEHGLKSVVILYLGDFDPSGMDMIRDISSRTIEFAEKRFGDDFPFEIKPIALTREQIYQYNPPPNPAKRTDPRSANFIADHGTTSWEVDALPPNILNQVLDDAICNEIDLDMYNEIVDSEEAEIDQLREIMEGL